MERRKITIARLRSGVNYKRPLDHIIDSFCYMLKRFQVKHDEFNYGVYNYGYDKAHRRKPDDIPDSDIIIIPSENEFHYHIPNYIDPKNLEKSNTAIKEHFVDLKDKHIIILRSDRGDDENLYRNHTFKDNPIRKVSILDETDIPGNIHQLKYHFIKDELPDNETNRPFLFTYWGTEKRRDVGGIVSGDQRHSILKQLQEGMGRYHTRFIGRFSTVKRDMKPDSMRNILPILNQSQYTLCFNWKDNKATTSRYHEALASGIIPMVYKDYDSTGILVKDDWQRVESARELCDKMMNTNYRDKFEEISYNYEQSLLTKDQIYDTFESTLYRIIGEKMTPEEKDAEIKRLTKQIQENAERNIIKEVPKRNITKELSVNIGAAQRLSQPYGYDPLAEWMLSNGNLHYTWLAIEEGYNVNFNGAGNIEYLDPSGNVVANSTAVWEEVVIPQVLANYVERKQDATPLQVEHSLILGADYYKYQKNFWLHAWGNIMPYHLKSGNEFSYHNYNGGQWIDYSGGVIFGYKFNKSLGVFAEGTYNKYWNRKWHKFSMGVNYIIF